MDVLPRITRQLIELFREMSLVQRVTSIAIPIVVLLAFAWLVLANRNADFQPVSFGKTFSTDEIAAAEQALTSARLTGFRRDGNRLMAPAKDLDRYNAALLEFDALPSDLGSQLLKQYETLGPFSTDRQRSQMKEALLLQELRRMIKAVPDIEDAHVVIASSERRISWNQKPRATANVTVKPREGREISATLVNSLRQVVANMVPDLKPVDVTIFDVTRGHAYSGEPTEDSSESRCLQFGRELILRYETQIQKALSHIPQVSVTANIDLEALKSALFRSQTNRASIDHRQPTGRVAFDEDETDSHQTGFRGPGDKPVEISEKQLIAAMPGAMQISISIPREYLRHITSRRLAKGETSPELLNPGLIEEEVIAQVERIVRRLIPAESRSDAISVNCVDRMVDDSATVASRSPNEQFVNNLYQWRGPIALGLIAMISLVLLRGTKPRVDKVSEDIHQVVEEVAILPPDPVASPTISSRIVENTPDQVSLLREEIRSMVESDPAASALLVSRWMAEDQH